MENQRQDDWIGKSLLGTGLVHPCGWESPKRRGIYSEFDQVDSGEILERGWRKSQREIWIRGGGQPGVSKKNHEVPRKICVFE